MSNAALRLVLAALASAPLTLSACGSATLDPDAGDETETTRVPRAPSPEASLQGVPLDAFAEHLARAFCEALRSCCQDFGLGAGPATCDAQAKTTYQKQVDDNLALGLRYQPLVAARCVAAFTHYLQGCSYEGRPAFTAACADLFQGTVALGQPCEIDAQCARVSGSGVYCAGDAGPEANTCQRAHGEGEQCRLEGCDEGLFCDFSLTCLPQQTSGTCFQFDTCAPGTACSPNGTCDPLLAAGDPCVLDLQCESGVCGDTGCEASFVSTESCGSL